MIRRSVVGLLCWLLAGQPAWAVCALDGTPVTQGFVGELGDPPLATTPLTTSNSNDLVMMFVMFNAREANSGGNDPVLTTAPTGGGLTWTQRFREHQTVAACQLLGNCWMNFEVWTAVAPSPLAAQSFTITYDTGEAWIRIFVLAYSGLANPSSPFDPNGSLPALGTNYAGGSGTGTVKETAGVSTSNASDILLWACMENNVTSAINRCDTTAGTFNGFTKVTGGYQQNIFTAYFNNTGLWDKHLTGAITGQTLTTQQTADTFTDWIAYSDALVCEVSPPTTNRKINVQVHE